jgi:hypothetical protein
MPKNLSSWSPSNQLPLKPGCLDAESKEPLFLSDGEEDVVSLSKPNPVSSIG